MSALTTSPPRLSPRPASCNDLVKLPQKSSPRPADKQESNVNQRITLPAIISSSSCNDLFKLSPRVGPVARDSSATCGWLPRVEDDEEPIELVNEDKVMIATVVDLMKMLGEPEKEHKQQQTLLLPMDPVKTSSSMSSLHKTEETPQVISMSIFSVGLYL